MRTTLEIEDDIFRMAKTRAAATRRTLGDLVTEALRESLCDSDTAAPVKFRMPVFGVPGGKVMRSVQLLASLRDEGH